MRAAWAASRECAGGGKQMKVAHRVCMLQIVGWKNCEHCTVVACGKVWWGTLARSGSGVQTVRLPKFCARAADACGRVLCVWYLIVLVRSVR